MYLILTNLQHVTVLDLFILCVIPVFVTGIKLSKKFLLGKNNRNQMVHKMAVFKIKRKAEKQFHVVKRENNIIVYILILARNVSKIYYP